MRIALAGNPNSGKTTMFNALTGSNEKVGNWAGVTVEKKEHQVKKSYNTTEQELIAVDLPGAYSMSPFTSEEGVTSEYIQNENPDVIINIVDATNLSRSLFFTTQLLELGIPVVVALNKTDINKKKKTVIDATKLSDKLGCPVVATVSTSADGLGELMNLALARVGIAQTAPFMQPKADLTDKKSALQADRKRFQYVNKVVAEVETRRIHTNQKNFQDKIDGILTNRWFGLPIFAAVMFLVFWISQAGPGVWIADLLTGLLEAGQAKVGGLFADSNTVLYALLVDGIIGGVIAVIGFLPLVMIMYFLIALLEDCGYMARASVVLDPIFKRVGLSGKSVIPFVIGTGCAVPGVMACRTIRDERERRATAMIAPFMPCGAKLPIIALFAGAFFRDATWVGPLMYFAGIIIIFLCALLINQITRNKTKKSYFIIELPEYKAPSIWRATKSMCSRGWSYVVKAATIILLCNTAVQIMQSFNWSFAPAQADASILASIARPLAYLLVPVVGVLSWQLAAASVTGFIAKENVVGTLAVCYAATQFIDAENMALAADKASDAAKAMTGIAPSGEVVSITAVAALAYLMFNLFSPPCFAAIGAMRSEIKSAKWLLGAIALQLGVGFAVGYLVYTLGTLMVDPAALNVGGAIAGGIAIAVMAAVLVVLCVKPKPANK